MTIMGFGEELSSVSKGAAGFVAKGAAITGQERYTSIPERCARAAELATELSGLLGGIAVDVEAYVGDMKELDPKGVPIEFFTNLAARAIFGTRDDELSRLPEVAADISSPGVYVTSLDLPPLANAVRNHCTIVRRAGTSVGTLGATTQRAFDAVNETLTTRTQEIDQIIDGYIAGL